MAYAITPTTARQIFHHWQQSKDSDADQQALHLQQVSYLLFLIYQEVDDKGLANFLNLYLRDLFDLARAKEYIALHLSAEQLHKTLNRKKNQE